jgi:hypothetical protein
VPTAIYSVTSFLRRSRIPGVFAERFVLVRRWATDLAFALTRDFTFCTFDLACATALAARFFFLAIDHLSVCGNGITIYLGMP